MSCVHLQDGESIKEFNGIVYKDECVKCFQKSNSVNGLDICLQCYTTNCSKPTNHSLLHFNNTSHSIVMNIRYLNEMYECDMVCLSCSYKKLNMNDKHKKIKLQILKTSNPYIIKSTIAKNVVEKVKSCVHCDIIQENASKDKHKYKDMTKVNCELCNIKSNLWFCLTCGFIGCSRKYFDMSGGNNHAINHYNDNEYHMVFVKIGTVTKEGKADIYCYKCDNFVSDKRIIDYMNYFGIYELKKFEKDTKELELEYNLKYDWSETFVKEEKEIFGKGYTGIVNIGNSCYFGSVLQILMCLSNFYDIYYKEGIKHLYQCSLLRSENCYMCQMSKFTIGIHSGEYSKERKNKDDIDNGVSPYMLKSILCKNSDELMSSRQQDANEFLSYTINTIKKQEHSQCINTTDIFNFNIQMRMMCTKCEYVKYVQTNVNSILLSIKETSDNSNLYDSFDSLIDDEFIDDYYCDECNKKTTIKKNISFFDFPNILVLPLKRFAFGKENNIIKLTNKIDIPTTLQLEKYRWKGKLKNEKEFNKTFTANKNMLSSLEDMGFSKNRSENALYNVNNESVEIAMNWLMENINDTKYEMSVNTLYDLQKGNTNHNKKKKIYNDINTELIPSLTSMGFEEESAKYALSETSNNIERAIDFLFSRKSEKVVNHPKVSLPPTYEIFAFITHTGNSIDHGHYITHIKKKGKWICYNDKRVTISDSQKIGMAYIIFYRNLNSKIEII